MYFPKIDYNLCKRCEICINICPRNVFLKDDDKIVPSSGNCNGCRLCELLCPDFAIEILEVENERTRPRQ